MHAVHAKLSTPLFKLHNFLFICVVVAELPHWIHISHIHFSCVLCIQSSAALSGNSVFLFSFSLPSSFSRRLSALFYHASIMKLLHMCCGVRLLTHPLCQWHNKYRMFFPESTEIWSMLFIFAVVLPGDNTVGGCFTTHAGAPRTIHVCARYKRRSNTTLIWLSSLSIHHRLVNIIQSIQPLRGTRFSCGFIRRIGSSHP